MPGRDSTAARFRVSGTYEPRVRIAKGRERPAPLSGVERICLFTGTRAYWRDQNVLNTASPVHSEGRPAGSIVCEHCFPLSCWLWRACARPRQLSWPPNLPTRATTPLPPRRTEPVRVRLRSPERIRRQPVSVMPPGWKNNWKKSSPRRKNWNAGWPQANVSSHLLQWEQAGEEVYQELTERGVAASRLQWKGLGAAPLQQR